MLEVRKCEGRVLCLFFICKESEGWRQYDSTGLWLDEKKLALQITTMSQRLLLWLALKLHCLRVALSPISLPVDVV